MEVKKKIEDEPTETVDYRKERRHVVLTVLVLGVWICFVLAVVSRSTSAALTRDSLSLEFIAPLLFVLLVAIVFLVIFCLPSRLTGEGDIPQGPIVMEDDDDCLSLRDSSAVT